MSTKVATTYLRHSILNANAIELQQQVSIINGKCSSRGKYNTKSMIKRTELVVALISRGRGVHRRYLICGKLWIVSTCKAGRCTDVH